MATKQSAYFKGNARKELPIPLQAGMACEVIITHVFTEAVNTTDVLEICPLMPWMKILGAEVIGQNIGATTMDIGYLTGTPGDTDAVRTCGNELFNDQAGNAVGTMTLLAAAGLAKNGDTAKSIGMVPAANIAASASTKLNLRLRYTV